MGSAGARKGAPVREEDLEGSRYLKHARKLPAHLHEHCDCPNRNLHYDDYATLLLFYFFNSILANLRHVGYPRKRVSSKETHRSSRGPRIPGP